MTLIDGYNLMHALGMAPTPGGLSLERCRLRMIDWLAMELGKEVANVCVVFDSALRDGTVEQVHRGITLLFSRGEKADDLIESFIRTERAPAQLTVVSNDHRIIQAARRGGCKALTCGDYLERLDEQRDRPNDRPRDTRAEKPSNPTSDEMAEWLERFGAE